MIFKIFKTLRLKATTNRTLVNPFLFFKLMVVFFFSDLLSLPTMPLLNSCSSSHHFVRNPALEENDPSKHLDAFLNEMLYVKAPKVMCQYFREL